MSTEATGDGQPDAVGAVRPDAEANAEPSATVVAERGAAETALGEATAASGTGWDIGEATAWAVAEPADPEANAAPPADGDAETEEAPGTVEADEIGEADEIANVGEAAEADEDHESEGSKDADKLDEPAEKDADEADEPAEDAAEYEDGEAAESDAAAESDQASEYDEDYEGYESGEAAEPRRARRWPRVLLALGFVVLAAAIVGGAVAIVGSITHGFKKPVKVTYKTSAVFSLKTGDCFDPQGAQSYTLVSCDSPHQAEVFATFALPGTNWPGDTAIRAQASGGCASRLTGYVNPQLAISLTSTYVYPDSIAWQAGTRTVICEVRATSGQLTGSVRGASASTVG